MVRAGDGMSPAWIPLLRRFNTDRRHVLNIQTRGAG